MLLCLSLHKPSQHVPQAFDQVFRPNGKDLCLRSPKTFLCIVMNPNFSSGQRSISHHHYVQNPLAVFNGELLQTRFPDLQTLQVSDHDHFDYIALCSDHPLEIEPTSLKLSCLYLMVSYLKL